MGNIIAEYADYALAYQLVGDSFRESLGEGQRYTDKRIRLIENEGPMTPRALSEKGWRFDCNDIPMVETVDRKRRFELVR